MASLRGLSPNNPAQYICAQVALRISAYMLFLILFFLTACQTLPAIAEVAGEEFVEKMIALEVSKKHDAINISLEVKKEPAQETKE